MITVGDLFASELLLDISIQISHSMDHEYRIFSTT